MRWITIISQEQFGYNTERYYFCKYLKDVFDILYLCWDHGLRKIDMEGVKVIYVSRKGNTLLRTTRFLRYALENIGDKRDIVFVKYFKWVSLALRLMRPGHRFVLDIRTASVHGSSIVRRFHDMRLKFESRFFRHITVVSESLAEKLGMANRARILPQGADIISSNHKSFESVHLLYVGTLFNRKIDVTIRGFKQFFEDFKDRIAISYTIIGDGPNNEARELKDMVFGYGLSHVVKVIGFIPYPQLRPWFDAANIGVSYIPMADYYDCQPVTKTFEYLLSGMPVIATNTSENRRVIDSHNGVIIGDSAEDFCSGLNAIYEKRHMFESAIIRSNAMGYSWRNIVQDNLRQYLESIYLNKNV